MRRTFLGLAWVFIFAAAAYDAYFAWLHRELMHLWEQNPFAAWMVGNFGLFAFFLFKFVGLCFAAALVFYCCSRRRKQLVWPLTLAIGCVYGFLSVYYVVHYDELSIQPAPILLSMQHALK